MDLQQYKKEAMATCANLSEKDNDIHMLLGMVTEVGELVDDYKKAMAYGKPVDKVNIKEEIGDILWYIQNFCTFNGFELDEVMQVNIDKLKARYPDKFTQDAALNRDLIKERKVLEGSGREFEILTELGYDMEDKNE